MRKNPLGSRRRSLALVLLPGLALAQGLSLKEALSVADRDAYAAALYAAAIPVLKTNDPEFATEAEHSVLDRLLYRWTILLPLPSDERSPVILDNQTPAGHEASRSGWSRRRRFLPARGW